MPWRHNCSVVKHSIMTSMSFLIVQIINLKKPLMTQEEGVVSLGRRLGAALLKDVLLQYFPEMQMVTISSVFPSPWESTSLHRTLGVGTRGSLDTRDE